MSVFDRPDRTSATTKQISFGPAPDIFRIRERQLLRRGDMSAVGGRPEVIGSYRK
jgi:hypothetical protein